MNKNLIKPPSHSAARPQNPGTVYTYRQ